MEGTGDDVAAGLFDWVLSAEELFPTKAPGALVGLKDPKAKEPSATTPNLELPATGNESGWVDSLAGAVREKDRCYKLSYGKQSSFIILTVTACFSAPQSVRDTALLPQNYKALDHQETATSMCIQETTVTYETFMDRVEVTNTVTSMSLHLTLLLFEYRQFQPLAPISFSRV